MRKIAGRLRDFLSGKILSRHFAIRTRPNRLPRIGGMATMPTRLSSCRIALPYILAQVDCLYLYLDKYDQIPTEFTNEPRIIPLLPRVGGWSLEGSGKFIGLSMHSKPCLYFCFDDDIIYSIGYVDHLAAALRRYHYKAIVGVHGKTYWIPNNSYSKDRTVVHFQRGLDFDCAVDELGTGTLAFHSSCIDIDPHRWAYNNKEDLMMMIDAVHQKVLRFAVRRKPDLLKPIEQKQDDSIYLKLLADDSIETQLLQESMERYPGRWSMSD